MPYYGLYIPAKGGISADSGIVNATNASNNSPSAVSNNDEKKDNETGKCEFNIKWICF